MIGIKIYTIGIKIYTIFLRNIYIYIYILAFNLCIHISRGGPLHIHN